MTIIAVAALMMFLTPRVINWRSSHFLALAQHHLRFRHYVCPPFSGPYEMRDTYYSWVKRPPTAARLAWHDAMWAKYCAAARKPWLPVWPDPPMPD
jgi:hypothetical protein